MIPSTTTIATITHRASATTTAKSTPTPPRSAAILLPTGNQAWQGRTPTSQQRTTSQQRSAPVSPGYTPQTSNSQRWTPDQSSPTPTSQQRTTDQHEATDYAAITIASLTITFDTYVDDDVRVDINGTTYHDPQRNVGDYAGSGWNSLPYPTITLTDIPESLPAQIEVYTADVNPPGQSGGVSTSRHVITLTSSTGTRYTSAGGLTASETSSPDARYPAVEHILMATHNINTL